MATITGLDPVSGQGTFEVNPVPVGASLPSGVVPAWTSSDVTLATVESPNSDSTGITIKVSRVNPAGGSITLTVALTLSDGTVLQDAVVVPVPALIPPPPPPLTGVSISQIG